MHAIYKLICVIMLCLAHLYGMPQIAHAHPQTIYDAPDPFRHTYGAYWTGIKVGELEVEFNGDTLKADIITKGLVKKITKYFSNTATDYVKENGGLSAARFSTTSRLRKRNRDINITYHTQTGSVLTERVNPPDRRAKRPAVPVIERRSAVDPLTAGLLARQSYIQALKKGVRSFDVMLYDARRLSRLEFNIGAKETIVTDFLGNVDVTRVTLIRIPLAGYTANEKRRMKAGEEPVITLFISNDGTHMPVKAIADAPIGSAVLYMEK